jgi:leader peptidase (prepilin peptidase) / N-methyltransferase
VPFWLGAVVVGIYGVIVGSFVNVLIYRLPLDQSIVFPASHCPKCKAKLRPWDNIPLFSFLLLGGKCRYCGEPISWRYFVVELVTACAALALYWRYGFGLDFYAFALLGAALIAVFFIDVEHWIIPDELSLFVVILGVTRNGIAVALGERNAELMHIHIPWTSVSIPMLASIPSLLACGAIFYVIAVVSEWAFKKEAMGGGDIKLAAAIGANLLFVQALASFFVAVFVGAALGIALLLTRKKGGKDALPFGPMMVIGVFAVLLAQPQLAAGWMAWQRLVTGWIGG